MRVLSPEWVRLVGTKLSTVAYVLIRGTYSALKSIIDHFGGKHGDYG